MKRKENEKKYLIKEIPFLHDCPSEDLSQTYIDINRAKEQIEILLGGSVKGFVECRVRTVNDCSYFLTLKSDGNNNRDESPDIELLGSTANNFIKRYANSGTIFKKRFTIYKDEVYEIVVDRHENIIFKGDNLYISEIEYKQGTEEEANAMFEKYISPLFIYRDVINNKNFKAKNLAKLIRPGQIAKIEDDLEF